MTLGTVKKPRAARGALPRIASRQPPSVTSSSRIGRLAAAALAIGGTSVVSTSFNCSTQSRMCERSPANGSSSVSVSRMRARLAICATAALSSAMILPCPGYHRSMILDEPGKLHETAPSGMRLMGLDVGTKTIGLALSDTRRVIATPLETIRRRRFAEDMARLFALVDAHGVGGLVIGMPLTLA